MKKQFLLSALLVLSFAPYIKAEYVHNFITLEKCKGLIDIIDGKTPGVNGDACLDMLQVRGLINKVLEGQRSKTNREVYIKSYNLDGKKVALDDLVQLEKDGAIIPGTEFETKYNKCLREIKEEFLKFTAPLLSEAEVTRNTTLLIVKEWCKKADREKSIMLNWGKADHEKLLFASSARTFRRFCRDLKNFLHDLMFNCPKGRELFKKERVSMMALKEAFTKLTGNPSNHFEENYNKLAEEYVRAETDETDPKRLKTYIDRRKKRKFDADGQLGDLVFEALEATDPALSKDEFAELFYKFYEVKCKKFDSSFIDKK